MLPEVRYLPSPRAAVTAAFIAYGASAGLWAGAIPAVTRNAEIDSLALGLGITFYGIAYVATMFWGGALARCHQPCSHSGEPAAHLRERDVPASLRGAGLVPRAA